MSYNNVLIVLAAFIAVTVAIPYFPIGKGEGAAKFEINYENNDNMPGPGPLMFREWNNADPMDQLGPSSVPDNDVDSDVESEFESEYEGPGDIGAAATAGGKTGSGEQGGAAGAAFGAAGAGANRGAAADAGLGYGMAGAGAPVVDSPAGTGGNSGLHVYAAGGPPPGQLKAAGSGRGSGVGIAIGISLLVVATASIAAFAIRHYWRHRL